MSAAEREALRRWNGQGLENHELPQKGVYRMQQTRTSHPVHPGRTGVIIVLIVVALGIVLLQSGIFVVREVRVVGTRQYGQDQVVAYAGIQLGQSIFSVEESVVAQGLSRDRYLILESLHIQYPDTVTLYVRERAPYAALTWLGVLVVLDEEGQILETSGQLDASLQIPVITGMQVDHLVVGTKLTCRNPAQIEAAWALLKELTLQAVSGRVSELNVSDLDNLYLITKEGMKVEVGNAGDMEQKIGMMRSVLDDLAARGIYTGSLDVSNATIADYWENEVVREVYRPDPTAVPKEMLNR